MKRGTIFLTFVLTSLFWLVLFATKGTRSSVSGQGEYRTEIVGCWAPVEGAEIALVFSRDNTLSLGTLPLKIPYEVDGNCVRLSGFSNLEMKIRLTSDGSNTYLEINGAPHLAGRYRKMSADESAANTTDGNNAPAPKPAVTPASKPVTAAKPAASAPKPATPKLADQQTPQSTISLAEVIVGKWKPVEGTKCPIEITKYGTFIHWPFPSVDMRYDYTLNGNRITIKRQGTGRVAVTTTSGGTYLEIYDITEFAGKYKKAQ